MAVRPTIRVIVENAESKPAAPASKLRNDAKGVSEYYFATMLEVNKAYIESAKSVSASYVERGKLIQTAATAIGTLYTGILGFLFVTGGDLKDPQGALVLGASGMIPTVFLGGAIALSMAFTSFLVPRDESQSVDLEGLYEADVEIERNVFVEWVTDIKWWRILLLQVSVVFLALGVAFMPVVFVDATERQARDWALWAGGGAVGLLLLGWVIHWAVDSWQDRKRQR